MSRKTSIYLPAQAEKTIKSFGPEASQSGVINTILLRYDPMARDAMPTLTEAEWSAICDALNGCGVWMSTGSPDPAPMIWAEIADSEPDGLGEKWGISCAALAQKLRDLPVAGRISVWDVAAKFWASPDLNTLPTADLLKQCGAKIAQEQ